MSQGRACEWPDGCNRGALREVDTAPIGQPGRRWLCLRHAGRAWNARKRANREAGRCPCGAAPTPGFKTCARCRERDTAAHRRGRRLAELARSCGLTLPRQAGRREAFFSAFRRAHRRSQRRARRAWNRALHRCRLTLPAAAVVRVSVPWEGHAVTCEAAYGLRGVEYVCGVPVPERCAGAAPGKQASRWPSSNDAEQLCGDGEDERALKGEHPSHLGAQGADLPVEVGLRLRA